MQSVQLRTIATDNLRCAAFALGLAAVLLGAAGCRLSPEQAARPVWNLSPMPNVPVAQQEQTLISAVRNNRNIPDKDKPKIISGIRAQYEPALH